MGWADKGEMMENKTGFWVCPKCGDRYIKKVPSCGNHRTNCFEEKVQVIYDKTAKDFMEGEE